MNEQLIKIDKEQKLLAIPESELKILGEENVE